jgi:hypothetical protein
MKLLPYVEKIVCSYLCGFKAGKSMTDQIPKLRQILERAQEYNISTFHLFIDFRATCDSIQRDQLFKATMEFGISIKLINLTKATLNRVKCRVRIHMNLSEQFVTQKRLR